MNTNEHQQPSNAIPCLVEVRTESGDFHRYQGIFPNTCAALGHALEKFGAWASITVSPLGGTSK